MLRLVAFTTGVSRNRCEPVGVGEGGYCSFANHVAPIADKKIFLLAEMFAKAFIFPKVFAKIYVRRKQKRVAV
jgi:hypothetical protein